MILAKEKHYYHLDENLVPRKTKKVSKVKKIRRFKASPGFFYAAVILVAFAVFLLLATGYAQIAAAGYEILDMKKQVKTLDLENQALERKIAQLQSLDRIESVAIGKLGMIKPDASEGNQFIAVESHVSDNHSQLAADLQKDTTSQNATVEEVGVKPLAIVDAFAQLIDNWTGRVVEAEAKTASD